MVFFLNRLYMSITAKIIIIFDVIIINEYYSWINRQQLDKWLNSQITGVCK